MSTSHASYAVQAAKAYRAEQIQTFQSLQHTRRAAGKRRWFSRRAATSGSPATAAIRSTSASVVQTAV